MEESKYCVFALIFWLGLTIINPIIGAKRKIGAGPTSVVAGICLLVGFYLQGIHEYILSCIIYVFPLSLMLVITVASERKKNYWE